MTDIRYSLRVCAAEWKKHAMDFQSEPLQAAARAIAADLLEAANTLDEQDTRIERLEHEVAILRPAYNAMLESAEKLKSDIAKALEDVSRLRNGEFICHKCGIRKDSDHELGDF